MPQPTAQRPRKDRTFKLTKLVSSSTPSASLSHFQTLPFPNATLSGTLLPLGAPRTPNPLCLPILLAQAFTGPKQSIQDRKNLSSLPKPFPTHTHHGGPSSFSCCVLHVLGDIWASVITPKTAVPAALPDSCAQQSPSLPGLCAGPSKPLSLLQTSCPSLPSLHDLSKPRKDRKLWTGPGCPAGRQ